MQKDRKHLAWFALSITGLILFVLLFGFMALPLIREVSFNQGTLQTTYTSFYQIAFSLGWRLSIFMLPTFIIIAPYFIWSIVSFALHIVGHKRGDKYKYINRHVSRMATIMTALFLLLMVVTIAITVQSSTIEFQYTSSRTASGYWAFVFTGIALCAVQIVGACMLKNNDKE